MVRPSSLGDVVHALSLVTDVHVALPDAVVDWVAEEPFRELPQLCPGVRNVIPVALRRWRRSLASGSTWQQAFAFRRELRAHRYDVILDLQEQVKGALIARSAVGVRHGFSRECIREPLATLLDDVHHTVSPAQHFAQRARLLSAQALGYRIDTPPRWKWQLPRRDPGLPGVPYVMALHATSRDGKLWPEPRWQALLGSFSQAGLVACLPWGSVDERMRSERIAEAVPGAIVPERMSITTVAGWLAHAEIAIGVDTGLTHFAAALGTRTLALFTETDPATAGVAIAGPTAVDLGGNGHVPTIDAALEAAGALLRSQPRC